VVAEAWYKEEIDALLDHHSRRDAHHDGATFSFGSVVVNCLYGSALIYGVTAEGGDYCGCGTIFKIVPPKRSDRREPAVKSLKEAVFPDKHFYRE